MSPAPGRAALRVAIEASALADPQPSGIPRYGRQLTHALAQLDGAQDCEWTVLYRTSRLRRRTQLPQGPRLRRQAWRSGLWPISRDYDVVHAIQYRFPPWRQPRRVATIYDLYALVGMNYDDPAERAKHTAIYHALARDCDRLIFISESTRRDFERLVGGIDPGRLHVTPLGVGSEFRPHSADEQQTFRAKYVLREPYLLFLGWQNPNKNLPRLLQAYAQTPLRKDYALVLAGRVPPDRRAALDEQIAALGLTSRVLIPGYMPDDDVPALYGSASALMFPSLYEGFGLPILEAMASGIPVLTSTVSSCPEAAGGHAVLVDPASVEEIARGIGETLGMSPQSRAAALAHAQSMNWSRTAALTLEVYRKAAAEPRRSR